MEPVEIRYARSGDISVAYEVGGNRPTDGIELSERSMHEVKGTDEPWQLYAVAGEAT